MKSIFLVNGNNKIQEQRLKLSSAERLQSYIRSYLARKHKKNEERILYDQINGSANVNILLGKLLFFYDAQLDSSRYVSIISQDFKYIK